MKVPLFSHLGITNARTHNAVMNVLESGRFIGGEHLDEFARQWAMYCGADYCVPTASGSAALTAAIRATIPEGSYIIVPAMSFAATAFSVVEAGCKPIYVDVTPDGLLDQEACLAVLRRMNDTVKGVIPVHLYGQWMELDYDIVSTTTVIEDACQAHGTLESVQGHAACFSFYPSKNLGAAGDAGAVVTDYQAIAQYMRAYINYGDPPGRKYMHVIRGTNARMDAVQAVILLHKLQALEATQTRPRLQVARWYQELGVHSIAHEPCSWHLYPILAEDPEELQDELEEVGIRSGHYYPYTLDRVVEGTIVGDIPEARFIADHVIALPMGPHLDRLQVEYIVKTLNEIAELVELEGKNVWKVKGKRNADS